MTAAEPMTLALPLPHPALSPNGAHGHWRRSHKHRKTHRQRAYLVTLQALNGKPAPSFTRYTLAFYFKTRRNRDDDNFAAMAKSYRDGIADALRIDDHTLSMAASPQMLWDPQNPRLEITLLP